MPFFTQAFTRQPVGAGCVRLGGADRAGVQRRLESLEQARVFFAVAYPADASKSGLN